MVTDNHKLCMILCQICLDEEANVYEISSISTVCEFGTIVLGLAFSQRLKDD